MDITDEQIDELRLEAQDAGNEAQVKICDHAQGCRVLSPPFGPHFSREDARKECARIIAKAPHRYPGKGIL